MTMGDFSVTCKCGRSHFGNWMTGKDAGWRCECGELYYIDPAGRSWGTKAITYAHETYGYFPSDWFSGGDGMIETLSLLVSVFTFVAAMRLIAWAHERDRQREYRERMARYYDEFFKGGGGRAT